MFSAKELAYSLSLSSYLESIGFHLFPWQKKVAECGKKRVILLCSRQSGKSTFVSSVPVHTAKYKKGSLNLVIAPTEDQAKEDMIKIKALISHDKNYPELIQNGQDVIKTENGSRIIIVIASDRACRGYSRPETVIIDEASRVPDVVYNSGVIPMLNNSPESKLFLLSTPFGKQGFFYNIWSKSNNHSWGKFFVRTPYTVDESDPFHVYEEENEEEFHTRYKEKGIEAYFSDNHMDKSGQEQNLVDVGINQYKQEFLCDFIEQSGQIFSYEDLDRFFRIRNDENISLQKEKNEVNFLESFNKTSEELKPKKIGGKFF